MIPFGEWIRMVQVSFQTDIILISYKSSLSQMIDLIIAMNFVPKSSQSDNISLGFDQFKVLLWKHQGQLVILENSNPDFGIRNLYSSSEDTSIKQQEITLGEKVNMVPNDSIRWMDQDDPIFVSNGHHFDKLQIIIISNDRSHHCDEFRPRIVPIG